MEKKYRIRIEDQLIELNSDEEYTELKNQYTNYKFMVNTQTLEITGIKTKKQPHTPKPPQWFMYWSENVFKPMIQNINDRIDIIEETLERHELELSRINATLERHELELSKINGVLERNNLS